MPKDNRPARKTPLAECLRGLRHANGYTLKQVADALDVHVSTYSHWESGRRVPSPYNIRLLSELYNIKVEEILKHTVRRRPNSNKK